MENILTIRTTRDGFKTTFHGCLNGQVNTVSGGYYEVISRFEDKGIIKIIRDVKEIKWSELFI